MESLARTSSAGFALLPLDSRLPCFVDVLRESVELSHLVLAVLHEERCIIPVLGVEKLRILLIYRAYKSLHLLRRLERRRILDFGLACQLPKSGRVGLPDVEDELLVPFNAVKHHLFFVA